jgi:hypothetical protein
MIEHIFDYFTPVIFPAGHMGTFLLNFLTPETNTHLNITGLKNWHRNQDSGEWAWTDGLGGLFGVNYSEEMNLILSELRQICPPEDFIERKATLFLNVNWLQYQKSGAIWFKRPSVPDKDILKKISDNINDSSLLMPMDLLPTYWSPYVKSHTNGESLNQIQGCKFKKKIIFCRFKPERTWLGDVLHIYKIYDFYKRKNINFNSEFSNNKLLYKIFTTGIEKMKSNFQPGIKFKELDYLRCIDHFTLLPNFKQDYIDFDIYRLVFKKDPTQIYEIDPNFQLTEYKKQMLFTAHDTSMSILKYYNLDHTLRVDPDSYTNKFLERGNLSQSGLVPPIN